MAASNHELLRDIRVHGISVDDGQKTSRVGCKYCRKVFSGFYALKLHLEGVEQDGVVACRSVPADLKQYLLSKSNRDIQEANSVRSDVKRKIGRLFFDMDSDFTIARSPRFKRIIQVAYGKLGHRVEEDQNVDEEDLKGWILEEEMKDIEKYVAEIKDSWTETGCSILLDEWIMHEKDKHLINFLVNSPQGCIYLFSYDLSSIHHNMDALQSLLDHVIEVVGENNVVQVITRPGTSWRTEQFCRRFEEKHIGIFCTVSVTHCINLMLERVSMMDPIRKVLNKAKSITTFMYNDPMLLEVYKRYTQGDGLVKRSKIKSATPFLTLQNMVSKQEKLREMFVYSASICESKLNGKYIAQLIEDEQFWYEADVVLKAAMPLVRVLGLIYGSNKALMGYIYETMDQAKEAIKKGLKNYMSVWKIIDEVWDDHLHTPLHALGYYLNPYFFYSKDFYCDEEISNSLLQCVVRMVPDQRVQCLISQQLEKYRKAEIAFDEEEHDDLSKQNIIKWWYDHGIQWPDLQRFAIRVLSQTCDGATRYELKRNLIEDFLTNRRSLVERKNLKDLVYVNLNLKLQKWNLEFNDMSNVIDDAPEEAIIAQSSYSYKHHQVPPHEHDAKAIKPKFTEMGTSSKASSKKRPR